MGVAQEVKELIVPLKIYFGSYLGDRNIFKIQLRLSFYYL